MDDAKIVQVRPMGKSYGTHIVGMAVSVIGTCPRCNLKSKYLRSRYRVTTDVDARCSECKQPYRLPGLVSK